jgi:hypothetical protein
MDGMAGIEGIETVGIETVGMADVAFPIHPVMDDFTLENMPPAFVGLESIFYKFY